MSTNEINVSKYVFPVDIIKLSLLIRIKNYIVATIGSGRFYRFFCAKNGINLPLRNDVRWSLPEDYVVEHNRLDQLGASRDRIISAYYNKYAIMQANLDDAIVASRQKLVQQENYLNAEKERLKQYVVNRNKSKDPQEIIFLDSKIESQKSLINNQEFILNESGAELSQLRSVKEVNYENWNDQLKNIEDEISSTSYKFILRLTRKVGRKLNYSDFKYIKPDYSEKVQLIIQSSKQTSAHKAKVKKVK